jgi:TolB-like protein
MGPFELRPRESKLLRGGQEVPLGSRAFETLVALIEADGEVVAREALMARVWPGVVVEDSNLHTQISTLRRALGDCAGFVATVPGRGYRFAGPIVMATTPSAALVEPRDAERASIAVLPFQNLSADPEQGYFADGIAEEVITALSRVRWLMVIARNSSFAYRGRETDVEEIGRTLGVRYVVDGSVRRAMGRVRITSHLVEAGSRAEIWAERFDGGLEDVFELQDRVSASIVNAIEPRLQRAEVLRARAKPTASLDAYDHYLRALGLLVPRTAANYAQALAELGEAARLDPGFAPAIALAAHGHYVRIIQGWQAAGPAEIDAMVALADRALALAPDDPGVLMHAGFVLGWAARGLAASLELLARALALNPNSAFAWYVDGWLRLQAGDPEAALPRLAQALRLSPADPLAAAAAHASAANAHLLAGRPAEAVSSGERAVREARDFAFSQRAHAASLALAGRMAEAAVAAEALLAIEPGFTMTSFAARIPLRDTAANRVLFEGMRRAGLPER